MIVCGFAGIGKSTLCKTKPMWIDLESTPFEKNWDMYARVAQHMSNQGYNVMVSCHAYLRRYMHEHGIDYKLVMPCKDLKAEYVARYKKRGNTPAFVESLENNWDSYVEELEWERPIRLGAGKFLADIANCIGQNGVC